MRLFYLQKKFSLDSLCPTPSVMLSRRKADYETEYDNKRTDGIGIQRRQIVRESDGAQGPHRARRLVVFADAPHRGLRRRASRAAPGANLDARRDPRSEGVEWWARLYRALTKPRACI